MVSTHHFGPGYKILLETIATSAVVSIGFFFNFGSRHDPPQKSGLVHFLEHLLFKGTKTRTSFEIVSTIESLGGDINAFTDKEELVIHCTVPAENWETALNIIADMVFHSNFTQEDIINERTIILNEMASAKEDAEDLVLEEFNKLIFLGSKLAVPILGNEKDLASINSEDIINFSSYLSNPTYLTCAICGPLKINEIKRFLAKKFPNSLEISELKTDEHIFIKSHDFKIYKHSKFDMVQFCIGLLIPHKLTYSTSICLQIISTAFGETMSSRLFQNIRECLGIGYSLTSFFSEYSDCGIFAVSGSCEPHQALNFYDAIINEYSKLLSSGLTIQEIQSAKNYLIGSIIIGSEQMENRVPRLIYQFQKLNSLLTIEETIKVIKEISEFEITMLLEEFKKQPLSVLGMGPKKIYSQLKNGFDFEK